MTNGLLTIVHFACPKCDLIYKAAQELRQENEKRSGRFCCTHCLAEVHVWSGSYDFTEWQAVVIEPARWR
jgi:hypothetical protein